MENKPEVAADNPVFNRQGPIQRSHGVVTSNNIDASNQMEKFKPEEISQKAANILSIHVSQSPQTQVLLIN